MLEPSPFSQLSALARTDDKVARLRRLGVEPRRGALRDPGTLRAGAEAADGVIHRASIHDFTDLPASVAVDRAAACALIPLQKIAAGTLTHMLCTGNGTVEIRLDLATGEPVEAGIEAADTGCAWAFAQAAAEVVPPLAAPASPFGRPSRGLPYPPPATPDDALRFPAGEHPS